MTGAILAGGKSSRFGENKAIFPVRGTPMIKRIIDILEKYTEELFIVANNDAPFLQYGVPIVHDLFPGMGPLAGLHAALSKASWKQVFLVACDMPFINEKLVSHMITLGKQYPMIVPYGPKGPEPLLAIYPKAILKDVEGRLRHGQLSMKRLIEAHRHKRLFLEALPEDMMPELSTTNINTKKELEKAMSLYDKCVSEKRTQNGR